MTTLTKVQGAPSQTAKAAALMAAVLMAAVLMAAVQSTVMMGEHPTQVCSTLVLRRRQAKRLRPPTRTLSRARPPRSRFGTFRSRPAVTVFGVGLRALV